MSWLRRHVRNQHFLIRHTKTEKHSNTQRNRSNKIENRLKHVYTVKCKFFFFGLGDWDLFSQYIFLAIAHVVHSFVKVSNFGQWFLLFFVVVSVFVFVFGLGLPISHRQFNEFNRHLSQPAAVTVFFLKHQMLCQIWFQVYAAISKFTPLQRTTYTRVTQSNQYCESMEKWDPVISIWLVCYVLPVTTETSKLTSI